MNNDRYVPQALPGSAHEWAVYDRLLKKFVSDEELKEIPIEALRTEQLPKH
jgi:hypothetical protein